MMMGRETFERRELSQVCMRDLLCDHPPDVEESHWLH